MVKKFKHRFILGNCLFGVVKLIEIADPDKYKYGNTAYDSIHVHIFMVRWNQGKKFQYF